MTGKLQINITLHEMQAAVERYREDGRAGDREEECLAWLWNYGHKELEGDRTKLCALLGTTWSTVSKVWRGKYEAGLDSFCELVDSLRKRVEEGRVVEFAHTPVTRKIFAALDYARDMRTMAMIVGPTGCSKTKALEEWASQNNSGRTVYVKLDSNCTRLQLVQSIAKAMTVSSGHKNRMSMEAAVKKGLKPNRVLLIDEAGHIIPDGRKKSSDAIEFIRDIYDTCHCAVVLTVTNVYLRAMLDGPQAELMEQINGRISYRVIVQHDTVYVGELEAMIRLYGRVEPDPKLLAEAALIAKGRDGRLRTLCEDLAKAAAVARTRGESVTWQHLHAARKLREAGGSWDDEEVA